MPRSFFLLHKQADDLRRCRASSCSQRTPARRKRRRRQPGPDPLPQHRLHCLPPLTKKSPSAGRRTSRARSRSYGEIQIGICLDDGRAFLAGDFPGNRERERRESSCQGKGRSSRAKGSRGDPFSLLFAALICLLLSEKHSRTTEKQELVFLNAVLPEKKHEGCSNNSRRARRGSNNGPSKGRRQEGE